MEGRDVGIGWLGSIINNARDRRIEEGLASNSCGFAQLTDRPDGLLSCYGHQVYTLEARTYRGGEEVQDVVSGGGGRLDVRLGSLKVEGAELRDGTLGKVACFARRRHNTTKHHECGLGKRAAMLLSLLLGR